MAERKRKLELTWIGKENQPKLEPRILLEEPEKSYHAKHKVSDKDIFDNRLIFGDNLLALKALEYELFGKIKCVFIDPPYNTGVAFEQYEDGIEHSLWLNLIRDRLSILHNRSIIGCHLKTKAICPGSCSGDSSVAYTQCRNLIPRRSESPP